eukprot:gene17791-biopygen2359
MARAWRGRGAGVARAWRGRGAGVARAWRGHGAGMARAWRGHGAGMARAWRGHGAGMVCSPYPAADGGAFCRTAIPKWQGVHCARSPQKHHFWSGTGVGAQKKNGPEKSAAARRPPLHSVGACKYTAFPPPAHSPPPPPPLQRVWGKDF